MQSANSNIRQVLASGQCISRHRHAQPYAAIVLSGSYREAGSSGRFRVKAGEVMFHAAFEAHLNCVEPAGAIILNIPLQARAAGCPHFGVANVDAIASLAEKEPRHAEHELLESLIELPVPVWDWPDLLAADLRRNSVRSLAVWSSEHGITPHSLSRGFRSAFGVTPKRFGLESKAHSAMMRIAASSDALSRIAADTGFSDQAHMTRSVSAVAGRPPSFWRA
jgi:AraC-like DNA-binding protein